MTESVAVSPESAADRSWAQRKGWLLACVAVFALLTVQLRLMDRIWWCACGSPALWSGQVPSSHNSQHLADPYSITHVTHGLIFFWFFAWLTPRLSVGWRLVLSLIVEAGWEVLENTDFIINRYREATVSLDYFGDSIGNSLGDTLAALIGFVLAAKLGFWRSVALIVATEILLLVWIRDNLFLNVITLFFPLDAVVKWQMGT